MLLGFLFRIVFRLVLLFVWRERKQGKVLLIWRRDYIVDVFVFGCVGLGVFEKSERSKGRA